MRCEQLWHVRENLSRPRTRALSLPVRLTGLTFVSQATTVLRDSAVGSACCPGKSEWIEWIDFDLRSSDLSRRVHLLSIV
ncbi:hypothetical protein EJ03DRAFT_13146 [Teratosphaeria nubilosa]|uniref:Uncharacterized protein n=1 Tax=Teratosphaeria nubilosa TaxID=161662 RepID=A0A6G1KW79_9PEZI|nr:hypothetical protein EJ03DRAFT_13146 [Teratosphaeria nubilosa]